MSHYKIDIEQLFRVYYRPLVMYALHFTGDLDMSQDVVSDCFAQFYEIMLSDRTKVKSAKSYLYSMVKNRAIKTAVESRKLIRDLSTMECTEEENDWVERSFVEARLWAKIDELPTSCRNILLMSKRDGMRNSEIAEELNISIKTVENQISKAYRKLREGAIKIYNFIFM